MENEYQNRENPGGVAPQETPAYSGFPENNQPPQNYSPAYGNELPPSGNPYQQPQQPQQGGAYQPQPQPEQSPWGTNQQPQQPSYDTYQQQPAAYQPQPQPEQSPWGTSQQPQQPQSDVYQQQPAAYQPQPQPQQPQADAYQPQPAAYQPQPGASAQPVGTTPPYGGSQPSYSSNNPGAPSGNPVPGKKKTPIALIAALGVLALGCIAVIVIFFVLPRFQNDPRKMFFQTMKAEGGYSSSPGNEELNAFINESNFTTIVGNMGKEASTTSLTFSADVSRELLPYEYADMAERFLADMAIKIDTTSDPAKQASAYNIAVLLADSNLASVDLVVDEHATIGVRSEELYPTYLTLAFDDLLEILSLTSGGSVPDISLSKSKELQDQLTAFADGFSALPQELAALKGPYIENLDTLLTKEQFVLEKDVSVNGISGKTYNKVALTLTGEQLHQLITTIADTAAKDDALMALIQKQYAGIYDYMSLVFDTVNASGGTSLPISLPEPDGIPSMLKNGLGMIGSSFKASDLPKSTTIEFYYDGTTVANTHLFFTLNIPGMLPDTMIDLWTRNSVGNDKVQTTDFEITIDNDDMGRNSVLFQIKLLADKANGYFKFTPSFSGPLFEEVQGLTCEYSLTKSGNTETLSFIFEAPTELSYYNDIPSFGFDIQFISTGNKSVFDLAGELYFKGVPYDSDSDERDSVSLRWYDGSVTYGPVSVTDLSTVNGTAITMSSLSDGTINEISQELKDNITNFLMTNLVMLQKYLVE